MTASLLTRARFRIALWCEAKSMPFRVRSNRPLSWVLRFASGSGRARYQGLQAEYVLKHILGATRRPYLMRDRRCLRQGLLAYRFLRAAGHDVELHFGVDQTRLQRVDMRAHCWIVQNGRAILNEPPEHIVPVLVHKI
jgi:hypothetical protein